MHNMTMVMMNMWFTTGIKGRVLFDFWNVQNAYEYAATCVFVIVLAIVYEWLSDFRAYFNTKKSYDDGDDQTSLIQHGEIQKHTASSKFNAKRHLAKTALHMVQLAVSYLLMLIAMTYNVGYFCCVIVGAGIGYYLFGRLRGMKADVASCHPVDD